MGATRIAEAIIIFLPPALTYIGMEKVLKKMDPTMLGTATSFLLGILLIAATLGPLIYFLIKDRQKDKDQFLESVSKRKPGKTVFR